MKLLDFAVFMLMWIIALYGLFFVLAGLWLIKSFDIDITIPVISLLLGGALIGYSYFGMAMKTIGGI